jgi:hypothetical protein
MKLQKMLQLKNGVAFIITIFEQRNDTYRFFIKFKFINAV